MFKFVAFAACVAVARAGVIGAPAVATYAAAPAYSAPLAARPVAYAAAPAYAKVAAPLAYAHGPAIAKAAVAVDTDFDPNPQYSYSYDIQDVLTGDSKNQHETRNGDVVQGSYSLVEPDGTRRIVEYTADPVNGFNAVVHKEGVAVQKAVVAAPAIAKVAAPLAYAAAPAFAKVAAPVLAAPAYRGYAAPAVSAHPIGTVGYAQAPIAAKAYLG